LKLVIFFLFCSVFLGFGSDFIRIELKEDVKNYDKILQMLFNIEVIKKTDKLYDRY